jgi:lysyl-tRNA synthetase class II
MAQLVEEKTGWKFEKTTLFDADHQVVERILVALREKVKDKVTVNVDPNFDPSERLRGHTPASREAWKQIGGYRNNFEKLSPAQELVEVYEKLVEPTLIDPTFVTQIPSVIIPLAKKNAADPFFADVYELAINGQEISPGYTELNDPDVQAANFAHQVGDEAEKQKTDDDFLTALKYGMPPAGGIGLGIDRLVMMLTGAESIRDVILFPLMRPQG